MKRGLLMKVFGWTEFYAKWGISGAKAWAYYAWAMENEATFLGNKINRTSDGYLKQEIKATIQRRKAKQNGKD